MNQIFFYPAFKEVQRVEQTLMRSVNIIDPRVTGEGLVATYIEGLLRGLNREHAISYTAHDVFIRTASSVTHNEIIPIIGLISDEPQNYIYNSGIKLNDHWNFYERYVYDWLLFKDIPF